MSDRPPVKFVGGVVFDFEGRILLEERSKAVSHFPGLWSVPGGTVDKGESADQAVIREILEETGLKLKSLSRSVEIPRSFGTHKFYVGEPEELAYQIREPQYTSALQLFAYEALPENTIIESVLAFNQLVEHDVQHSAPFEPLVDQVFSSIFYSRLFPHLQKTWPQHPAREILFYTVQQTPWRKFKSCVPYLLNTCHPSAITLALLAEVLFSIFYIMDDLCDGKGRRYGRVTSYGAFGAFAGATFLLGAHHQTQIWLRQSSPISEDKNLYERIKQLVTFCFERLCAAQLARQQAPLTQELSEYELRAVERTAFLGDLWGETCRATGHIAEARLIEKIYPSCAFIGQLKNDLRDIEERDGCAFEDVARGVLTAPTIVLLERCSSPERHWFISEVWAKGPDRARECADNLHSLYQRHEVAKTIQAKCRNHLQMIQDAIRKSCISEDKQLVLRAWVRLQFEHGLLEESERDNVGKNKFIDAIARLTF